MGGRPDSSCQAIAIGETPEAATTSGASSAHAYQTDGLSTQGLTSGKPPGGATQQIRGLTTRSLPSLVCGAEVASLVCFAVTVYSVDDCGMYSGLRLLDLSSHVVVHPATLQTRSLAWPSSGVGLAANDVIALVETGSTCEDAAYKADSTSASNENKRDEKLCSKYSD
eukprot:gene8609-34052_t